MKIIVIQVEDAFCSAAEAIIGQLQELQVDPDSAAAAAPTQPPTTPLLNRPKVEALQASCRLLEREITTNDVILLSGVDESQFFRWQRGDYVGKKTRHKIESILALSAEKFLSCLDAPPPDLKA